MSFTDFFGRSPIPLYYRRSWTEVQWFVDLISDYPEIRFTHPNRGSAPWHVQGELPNGVVLDFWPHTTKGKVQYSRHVETTVSGIRALIEQQMDLGPRDVVDVIEDFDEASLEDTF